MSDLIVPFLDIGKEGELQGQIKSVIRDLEVMLRINFGQKEILEKFESTLEQISRHIPAVNVDPLHAEIKSSIDNLEDMRKSAGDISSSVRARGVPHAQQPVPDG